MVGALYSHYRLHHEPGKYAPAFALLLLISFQYGYQSGYRSGYRPTGAHIHVD